MEQAYAAIGRAVVAAQVFETGLVPIFEFFKMHTEPGYREKTGGYARAGAFKVPITNIVKALAAEGRIAPDLEARLTQYAEDRHTLIHRWISAHGWPDENDAVGFAPIMELAGRVHREANDLARLFVGYLLKFADPDWARANGDEYKERMRQLFHRAHLNE